MLLAACRHHFAVIGWIKRIFIKTNHLCQWWPRAVSATRMCWKPPTWPSWRRLFAKSFFLFWDRSIYCGINIYKLDCPSSSSLTGVENQLPEGFNLQHWHTKNNDRRMKHTRGIHCLGKYRGIFSLWPMLLLDSVPWQYWKLEYELFSAFHFNFHKKEQGRTQRLSHVYKF